ncbi:MAG: S9 family peptidase [Fluviicola sp.]|nr:S9 family peptidase [Fluviicola sp.]
MKFSHLAFVVGFLASTFSVFGQKKILGPEVYNDWKRIGDVQISSNGMYSAYTIKPFRGDGYLFIVNNETGKKDSIARGIEPQFSGLNSYLVFKIHPGFDTLRKVELNKIAKDKWPKDSLGIWFLANDSLVKIPKVKEYKISSEGDLLAYLSTTNDWPKNHLSKKEKKKEAKLEKKNGAVKTDGKLLTIWSPSMKKAQHFRHIQQFDLTKNGAYLAFVEQQKFKKDSVRLCVFTNENNQVWKADKRFVEFSGLNFGFSNSKLVGLATTDTTENKRWNLFAFDAATSNFQVLIDTATRYETNRVVSDAFKPKLINNDNDLFFGVWDQPEAPVKDSLLESEKVKLDLWHWKDDRMQPQQLNELKDDQEQTNLYVYHFKTGKSVQLGRDSLDINLGNRSQINTLLASCEDMYRFQTWHSPNPANYYTISLEDGKLTPLRDAVNYGTNLSPSGNYFSFWNDKTLNYYEFDVNEPTEHCMTCGVKSNVLSDLNGMPSVPDPLGLIGWTKNEKGLLIQAERDILYYDAKSHKTTSITGFLRATDRDTNYNYSIVKLESDSLYFASDYSLLTQFNKETKAMNLYKMSGDFPFIRYELLAGSNHNYTAFKRAKKSKHLLFQRHSNLEYPDLYVSKQDGSGEKQLSMTNPQQSLYNWSTVELIKWTSYEGIPLEGLIYKPENFDTNKEYPLLVYFYELYADEIHNHYAPKPTASIIFPTEYASAGYVVFIPDIRYKPGHPANGAYDCIMSGTDAVLKKYSNIDSKRMGLQGQSWGGYQTAQLITMTNRYAAAMAGAPVGNMFSAYGGIRWGSGYSRQFQYEHQQSRIGKTIWEAPELYIENSPIFHLPKVQTPLLIMHNDQDGAVPWYQGIELYTGLRRLQKPVWMLNYNGDDHNLMKNPNRVDLSIRMRQYFDYYLLGAPMPLWLKDGIPAIDKGKKFNYELIDKE